MRKARRPVPNRRTLTALVAASLIIFAAGCDSGNGGGGNNGGGGGGDGGAADFPNKTLRIMAPASPGGGWDQTSRAAQRALEEGGVVEQDVEVFNVPGAGGTIGLAQLAGESGNSHLLMTMGLVMVGAIETNNSEATLDSVTPIARLIGEWEAVVVPADSPHQTLQDFVDAWKEDPGAQAIAGGSAGGVDHILAGLMAKAAGIDPQQINYVAFSGGGEALAAILGGEVAIGISGIAEFADQVESGELRLLAVSSPERIDGVDAPTLTEAGLDVELENWRGLVAPADLPDAERDALVDIVTRMHDTEQWQEAVTTNKWNESFLPGDEFASFLEEEQTRVKGVLAELGLV